MAGLIASVVLGLVGAGGPAGLYCATIEGTGERSCTHIGEGGASGHESGGLPDPPAPDVEEPPCDPDVPECGENGEEKAVDVPFCRQDDEAIDELARQAAQELANVCFGNNGGSSFEHAIVIYRDGVGSFSIGNICVGTRLANGTIISHTDQVDTDICLEQDNRSAHEVTGWIHCGVNWSQGDTAVTNAYAAALDAAGMSTRVRELRGYLLRESGEILEKQHQDNGECEKDVSE